MLTKKTESVYKGYPQQQGFFLASQGEECFWQAWIADPSLQRNIIIHHGLGEHSGMYGDFVDAFLLARINLFAYDARGHGKNKGKQGLIKNVNQLALDLDCFLTMLEQEFSIKKPILYGHSLGGLVGLHFSINPIQQVRLGALAINAPALHPVFRWHDKLRVALARPFPLFFSKIILTRKKKKVLSQQNHEQDRLNARKNDPLTHDKISGGLAMDLAIAGKEVLKKAHLLSLSLFITHGEQDQIVYPSGSAELYQKVASRDKKLIMYPGLDHEVHNETPGQREKVLKDLKQWILQRMQ